MKEPEIQYRKAKDGTDIMHREVSCGSKAQYKTEREAWFALRKQMRDGARKANYGTYQCAVCWMWHNGKRP